MGCAAAKKNEDGRFTCDVSGDDCMFLFPNSKKCAEKFGEGPDANYDDIKLETKEEINQGKTSQSPKVIPEESEW